MSAMRWRVRLRIDVETPPLWVKEAQKPNLSQLSRDRLSLSKRSIIKQHVKHVTAMRLYKDNAEGWCMSRGDPLWPMPTL
jgi:hypothetical protein